MGGSLVAYGQTTASNITGLDAYMHAQPEYQQFYQSGGTSKQLFQTIISESPAIAAGLLAQYKLADAYVAPAKQAEAELSADIIKVVAEHPEVSIHDSTWDTTQVQPEVFTAITIEVQQEFKATIQENPELKREINQITTEVVPALEQEVATAVNMSEVLNQIQEGGGAVQMTVVDPATNQAVAVPVTDAASFSQVFLTSIQEGQTPQQIIQAFTSAVTTETEQNNISITAEVQQTLTAFPQKAVNEAASAFKEELVQSAAVPSGVAQGAAPTLNSVQAVADAATDNVAETATRAFISGNFQEAAQGASHIQTIQRNFLDPEKAVQINEGLKALQGADTATMQREMVNFAQKYGGVEMKSEQFNKQNLQAFQQGVQQAGQYSTDDVRKMAQEHQNMQNVFTESQQGGSSQQQTFGFDRTVGEQGRGFGVGQQSGFTPPGQSGQSGFSGSPTAFPSGASFPTGFNQQSGQQQGGSTSGFPGSFQGRPFTSESSQPGFSSGFQGPSTGGFSGSGTGFTSPKTIDQAQQQYGQPFSSEQKAAFEQYQNNTPPSMAPGTQASGSYKSGAMPPPPPPTSFTPGTSGTAPTTQGMPAGTMPTNATGSYKPGTAMSPSQPPVPPPPGFTQGTTPTTFGTQGTMPAYGTAGTPSTMTGTAGSTGTYKPPVTGTTQPGTTPSFTPGTSAPTPTTGYTGTGGMPSFGGTVPASGGTFTAPTGSSYPSFQPSAGGTSGYVTPSFTSTGTYTPPSTGSFTPTGTYMPPPSGGSYTAPSSGGTAPSSGGAYTPPSGGSYSPPPSGGSYSPPPSGGSYSPPPSGGGSPPPTGSVYDSYLGSVRNTLRQKSLPKPTLRKTPRQPSSAKNNAASIIDNFDYYGY